MVWYGLAIGAVVGSDGDSSGKKNTDDLGGAVNGGKNSDGEKSGGAQGLFSAFGHQVWFYVGGILGFGERFGVYGTTGPMIGADCDWAIGGGVHIGRAFGVGVVVPIKQALQASAKHSDKLTYLIDQTQQCVAQASSFIYDSGFNLLERVAHDPTALATTALMAGMVVTDRMLKSDESFGQNEGLLKRAKNNFGKARAKLYEKLSGL